MRKLYQTLNRWFHLFEDAMLVMVLLTMILLAVTQIFMRNVFDSSLLWADPVIRIAVLWIGLMGAMIGTRKGEHIAIDILDHYASFRVRNWATRLTALFACGITGLMTWACYRFLKDEIEFGSTAFGEVPAWPFELILPLAFGVMFLRYLAILVLPSSVEDEEELV